MFGLLIAVCLIGVCSAMSIAMIPLSIREWRERVSVDEPTWIMIRSAGLLGFSFISLINGIAGNWNEAIRFGFLFPAWFVICEYVWNRAALKS